MEGVEFTAYPKTPRLFRDTIITEKIDGTNAAVGVTEDGQVYAQSRKRLITPEDDNFGFATWVAENASMLAAVLGEGLHFGEWWGAGIQRGYLKQGRYFSLFNADRYREAVEAEVGTDGPIRAVPVLHRGTFSTVEVYDALFGLARNGSAAAPGFMRPEGVVIYHTASRQAFKALLENDGQPKSAA